MNKATPDTWLDRAFQLAYFLHGDRATAVAIAVRAMNKIEVAATLQSKTALLRTDGTWLISKGAHESFAE